MEVKWQALLLVLCLDMVLQLNSYRKSNNCLIAYIFCQDADEEVVVTDAPKKKKKKRDVEEAGLAEPDATGTHFLCTHFCCVRSGF